MKNPRTYTLPYRRKRIGRTNYRKRLKLLSSKDVRFVVRKSLKNLNIALVRYSNKGDVVELNIHSSILDKYGWKADKGNIPAAYLLGYLAGKKANEKGIKRAVLDIGLNPPVKYSKLFAAVIGAIDAGLQIPNDKGILPSKERLNGTHIAKYAELLKKDNAKYERYFSQYIKKNLDPAKLPHHVEEIKTKIGQK